MQPVTQYTALISETNAIGTGNYSTAYFTTSFRVPDTPTQLIVELLNASFVGILFLFFNFSIALLSTVFFLIRTELTWNEPYNGGSSITEYIVLVEEDESHIIVSNF